MTLQFIRDNKRSNNTELSPAQKQSIDDRLNDYYLNASDVSDFDRTIDDVEKGL